MSSLSSQDSTYNDWKVHVTTAKFNYALVHIGHQLLFLTLRCLVRGDYRNVNRQVSRALGSNSNWKNRFTRAEQNTLETEDPKLWDITLLCKVIPIVCGLEPIGSPCWTQLSDGSESLEFIIRTIKDMRNTSSHCLFKVISYEQFPVRLIELKDIAKKLTTALTDRAQIQGKIISNSEVVLTLKQIDYILKDVELESAISVDKKRKTDEDDGIDSDSQEDDDIQDKSPEELVKYFHKKFYQYAGISEAIL